MEMQAENSMYRDAIPLTREIKMNKAGFYEQAKNTLRRIYFLNQPILRKAK